MKRTLSLLSLVLALAVPAAIAAALDAETLMNRIDAKQRSETSWTRMSMSIIPGEGGGSTRGYRIESFGRGESDSYMVFLEPGSIRGLRILEAGDDLRVFFPSTGRVRRITGDGKGGSAGGIGGDFSYEDLGSGSYGEDYRLSLEGSDEAGWVIRGVPTDPESSYTHLLFYVDKQNERVLRTEYFNEEEGHIKTLIFEGYRDIQGVETPSRMEMTNHGTGQKTMVTIEAAQYNLAIDEKYFNPNRFYR